MILIGIPASNTINTKMAFSLLNMYKWNTDMALVVFEIGCDVAHNRNKLAMRAIEEGADHLLMIDSDTQFNPDLLDKMLEHDKDILGVAINQRTLPLKSNVKPLLEGSKTLPTELFEAESVGTGVMLIKTPVLEKIGAPWFEFSYEPERLYYLGRPNDTS